MLLRPSILAAATFFTLGACGDSPADAAIGSQSTSQNPAFATSANTEELPPQIKTWLAQKRAECLENEGAFEGAADYYLTGDFNGDGETDYILTDVGIDCPHPDGRAGGALGGYGRAGPPNEFLVSGPDGHRIAGSFSSFLEQSNVQRRGKSDVVILDAGFNGSGGLIAKVVWGWDGDKIDLLERYGEDGEKVDKEGYPLRAVQGNALSLPIRQGNYVMTSESCSDPISVYRFEGNRVHYVPGSGEGEYVETIARIDRSGNTYELEFFRPADYEEDEMTGADNYMMVEVQSETEIRVTVQDYSDKRFCPVDSLPAAFRR